MTKRILIGLFAIFAPYVATATECPAGYENVHLEQMTWSDTASCPAGTMAYYDVDEYCNEHIK